MTISRATCPRAWDARRSVVLAVAGLLAGMALASGPDPTEPLSPALASQPRSRALAAYARHTGIQVIYVSAVVRGQQSAALPAGLVPAEALLRLLEHSGLRFEFVNPRTVRIFEASHDAGPQPNGTGTRGAFPALTCLGGDGTTPPGDERGRRPAAVRRQRPAGGTRIRGLALYG